MTGRDGWWKSGLQTVMILDEPILNTFLLEGEHSGSKYLVNKVLHERLYTGVLPFKHPSLYIPVLLTVSTALVPALKERLTNSIHLFRYNVVPCITLICTVTICCHTHLQITHIIRRC